jgi:hypothetical protein
LRNISEGELASDRSGSSAEPLLALFADKDKLAINALALQLLYTPGSHLNNSRVVSAAKTTVSSDKNQGHLLYVANLKDRELNVFCVASIKNSLIDL